MARKNKRKPQPYFHGATIYDKGFAFAGKDFKCMTSDGQCLKKPLESKERDNGATISRTS
ncbi:hypothetical protein [Alkalibaculum bacchi]|uniref:hypothetical protein n=1 Tax=Alkalibaculum bacchi TaxID=645887 RepID=UPI0026F1C118|nr:hypothetical protein [Alkalibaculum bacchi]